MAKLLYSIKICLLEQQIQELPKGTVTTTAQTPKVRDFVNFVTLVYSKWWLTCPFAFDAPWNDLDFYKKLLQYDALQSHVSRSAIKGFGRHLWYLTQEMIPLALFSDSTPSEEKTKLAE